DTLLNDPYRKSMESALYSSQANDINRSADLAARNLSENEFANGMGFSTVLPQLHGQLEQNRLHSLENARNNAFINSNQQARLEAQQAFEQGTRFPAEQANIAAQREQQANQFQQ